MVSQNTSEWLEMRKNKIGASDAPVIMQVSPWKTPYKLWEEKLDLSSSNPMTPSMRRGHDLEDLARQELENMTGLFFLPEVKFHPTLPWMMASLDAIDAEGKCIAEIKCPNREDHQVALSGQVPEKYIPQLQHQLEVCELEMGYYFSFDGKKGALVKIFRNDNYIKKMIEKEQQFWECMQSCIAPEMIEADYDHRSDDVWGATAREWGQITEQMKSLEIKEKQLRETIISMAQKRNAMGRGIRVTKTIRKGNIEYSSIPELQTVDLEKYRKKPVESYRITSI